MKTPWPRTNPEYVHWLAEEHRLLNLALRDGVIAYYPRLADLAYACSKVEDIMGTGVTEVEPFDEEHHSTPTALVHKDHYDEVVRQLAEANELLKAGERSEAEIRASLPPEQRDQVIITMTARARDAIRWRQRAEQTERDLARAKSLNEAYRQGIEEIDAKVATESDQENWIRVYLVPAGQWHKLLGYARGREDPHVDGQEEGKKMIPKCCYVGCDKDAEWTLVEGPGPDDWTEACTAHVGDLLTDAKETRVYPLVKQQEGQS